MRREHFVAAALATVCTLLPFAGQFYGDRNGGWLMVDFKAYYCAASATVHHENPYFAASLHPCERVATPPYYRAPSNVTVPAPYPPYVLIMLHPLTLLPFETAAVIWQIALFGCALLAAYALSRVTRQPFLVGWAVLSLSLGLVALDSGNIIPTSVAAILIAALCAQLGYLYATAIALAVAMVEPQVAVPAAIATFVRFPSIRLTLVLLFALLSVGSLAASGLARNIAYFTTVLPAHALSEVSRDNQYSLSTVVSALGVPDRQAIALGGLSYVIAALLGIVVGSRLAREYNEPAFSIVLPPAFSLLGGSFVHTGELAIASAAALLLYARCRGNRQIQLVVVLLLCVPWMLSTSAALWLAPLFPVAYLTFVLGTRSRAASLAAALVACVVVLSLFYLAAHAPPHAHLTLLGRPRIDPRLAEASWRNLVIGNSTNRLITWLLRIPSWAGLLALAVLATMETRANPLLRRTANRLASRSSSS